MEKLRKINLKIVVLLIIIGFNWTELLAVGSTLGVFNDIENSAENIFSASTLYFSLNSPEGFMPEGLGAGEQSVRTININNGGSLNFEYKISSKDLSGDLCNYINLEANLDGGGVECADTALNGFNCTSFLFSSPEQWIFDATLSADAPSSLEGSACNFKLAFEGWQEGFNYGEGGFTDIQEIENMIRMDSSVEPIATGPVADVVLNEFLPNPNGDFGNDDDDKPLGEWVELYNNGDTDVDLTNWYVTDFSGGSGNTIVINSANTTLHLLPETTTISAHGFLVVYMNKSILNNTGDTVKLFNASGGLVDSISYGDDPTACDNTPTPSSSNQNDYTGTCFASNVPENKSFARIPDGVGNWVDPFPTPGRPNVLEEEDAPTENVSFAPENILEPVVDFAPEVDDVSLVETASPSDQPLLQPVVAEDGPPNEVAEPAQDEISSETSRIIEIADPAIEQAPVVEPEAVVDSPPAPPDDTSVDGQSETISE